MGAATDSFTCGKQIFDQVMSVGEMALSLVTLGASNGATKAVAAAKQGSKFSGMVTKFRKLKNTVQTSTKFQNVVKKA